MESVKLKIVVHAAKDLQEVRHLGTMNPYAVVWIAGNGSESKLSTNVANKGGTNPEWNCRMEFDIVSTQNDYILFCQLKHKGTTHDRTIGEVQVSFAELLTGDAKGEKVSYPVKISPGEEKGKIILSHSFSELIVTDPDTGTGTGTSEVGDSLGNEKNGLRKWIKDKTIGAVGRLVEKATTDAGLSELV